MFYPKYCSLKIFLLKLQSIISKTKQLGRLIIFSIILEMTITIEILVQSY